MSNMDEQDRTVSSMNNKASDSGYGSNKSNSQSQRSSDSNKSQHSSISSGSGNRASARLPNAVTTNLEQQLSPGQGQAIATSSRPKDHKLKKKKQKCSSTSHPEQPVALQPHQHVHLSQDQKPSLPPNVEQNMNIQLSSTPPPQSPATERSKSYCDSKALQMAALTRALSCMKRFSEPPETNDENIPPPSDYSKWQRYFEDYLKEETGVSNLEDGFATSVSMEDGVVVHITPAITNVLGFPKDMWVGRSFIDFVHPKDRMAFASHITCGVSFVVEEQAPKQEGNCRVVNSEPFFCRMRQYRGLKSTGFGVVDKAVVYIPFKLTMKLKEIRFTVDKTQTHLDIKEKEQIKGSFMHLIIIANRIKSAFQDAEEIPINPVKFITRHSATCNFGHFDTEGIGYLGHLPQDLIGNSVLDYYHPDDMLLLKSIYEGVMLEQGKPFRSKPYRFRAFNGTFALLETDWSCFINPWSWKLEFVIGQHRVLKGPLNPNVFMQPREEDVDKFSDKVLSDCKIVQDDIKKLLTETVSRRLSDPMRQQCSRRRKNLAALMENLLEQMAKSENSEKSGSQCSGGTFSVMERDSVMLGEISPHHDDHSGSNQSSETPPSYSQLNYRENIERFFQSQPKTSRSDESPEKMETNRSSTDEEYKSSQILDYSSGSNNRQSSGSNGSGEGENAESFEPCCLTEDLLSRHNENMEKFMAKRHKESRVKTTASASVSHKSRCKHSTKNRNILRVRNDHMRSRILFKETHGIKRGTNAGWGEDSEKYVKLRHLDAGNGNTNQGRAGKQGPINLWPPFSISMTPGFSTPKYSTAGGIPFQVPNYQYLPAERIHPPIPSLPQSQVMSHGNMNLTAPLVLVSGPGQQQFIPQPVQYAIPPGVIPVYQPVPSIYTPSVLGLQRNSVQPFVQSEPICPLPMQMPVLISPFANGPRLVNRRTQQGDPTKTSGRQQINNTALKPLASTSGLIINNKQGSHGFHLLNSNIRVPNVSTVHNSSKFTTPVKVNAGLKKGHGPPQSATELFVSLNATNCDKKRPHVLVSSSSESRDMESLSSTSYSLLKNGNSEDSISISLGSQNKDSVEDFEASNQLADTKSGWQNDPGTRFKNSQGMANSLTATDIANRHPSFGQRETANNGWTGEIRMDPLNMTPEIIFRFQLPSGDLNEILRNDLNVLKLLGVQSGVVNQQLDQLYGEIEKENGTSNELLEDLSGSSSNELSLEELKTLTDEKLGKESLRKETRKYCRMVMVHEENAPFPSSKICFDSPSD